MLRKLTPHQKHAFIYQVLGLAICFSLLFLPVVIPVVLAAAVIVTADIFFPRGISAKTLLYDLLALITATFISTFLAIIFHS